MPQNKPALFRSPVRPGWFKQFETTGPLPGERRFNTAYPDSMRCLKKASLRCGPGVHTVATAGLKPGQCE